MKPSRIQMNPENIIQTHKTMYCADFLSMKWLEQAETERRLLVTKGGVGWGGGRCFLLGAMKVSWNETVVMDRTATLNCTLEEVDYMLCE